MILDAMAITAESDSAKPETETNTEKPDLKSTLLQSDENDATPAQAWTMDISDFSKPKALAAIMIGLFLAIFTNNLDATIIATAIPYITDDFETIQDVAWYVSATFMTFAAFQSTWGKALK